MTSAPVQPRAIIRREDAGELAAGDRVRFPIGCNEASGTIIGTPEPHYVTGVNGPVLIHVIATVHVVRFPTYDQWGWPKTEPRTITWQFRRYASDFYDAYAATSERIDA